MPQSKGRKSLRPFDLLNYAWRDSNNPQEMQGKAGFSDPGGATSDAISAQPGPEPESRMVPDDPDLHRLIDAWPRLSEYVRRSIMGLLDARR